MTPALPRIRRLTREHLRQARKNDPAAIFRAAKRLACRALVMRETGRRDIARVAMLHARLALVRALDLRGPLGQHGALGQNDGG